MTLISVLDPEDPHVLTVRLSRCGPSSTQRTVKLMRQVAIMAKPWSRIAV